MKSPQTLILASTSAYRRELLTRLRIPFESMSPSVDETPLPHEHALALTTRLARAKALAVATQRPQAWVIGSDQVAELAMPGHRHRILGKPGSNEQCIAQLHDCSGQTLVFTTAVALLHHHDRSLAEFIDTTRVVFRTFDAATIERYVQLEAPLDCAGGFKCEGLGISLCSAIETTDPTALIGLPLIRLAEELRRAGFELP